MPRTADRHGVDARLVWFAVAAWLALNGLLLWLYHAGAAPKTLIGDEFDYNRRALALLAGDAIPETYIWPPGQTWFIAAVYRVFGVHVLGVQLVQIALLGLCAVLLARLWRPVAGAPAAFAAGALFLLNPTTVASAHWLWPEVTHLACLLGALALLFARRTPRIGPAFAAGLLIGLALLFKSLLGLWWPLLLLRFVTRDGRLRVAWGAAACFVCGVMLAIAPALWKGHVDTGRPIIADSSIYNLDVGLRDRSRSDYIDEAGAPALAAFLASAPTPQERNAIYLERVRETVERRGLAEVLAERLGTQYFRLFSAKTLLVSQLPGDACAGRLGAYPSTMLTPWLVAASMAWHASTLVLAAFGVALWRNWRAPIVIAGASLLAYQLALYLGLHVMQRYLFQMLPFLCAFGAGLVAARDRAVIAVSASRLAVGALLALLLLALAFLGPWLDGTCR
ncbi:MAG: glycosyltransferase family 39 protein [Xanthomonadales bacterium]|nr:glycosyltransferase family 39 protein [Xanthomonadales bacterium]